MLKKTAIVIIVLLVAVLGFAATRPDDFRVQRSVSIKRVIGHAEPAK